MPHTSYQTSELLYAFLSPTTYPAHSTPPSLPFHAQGIIVQESNFRLTAQRAHVTSTVERTRLYEQNDAVIALIKNRIIHAPISSLPPSCPRTILDVGCGPGYITRHLSSKYPDARLVCGIDLDPVPPKEGDASAKNLSFIQGDFRKLAGTDPSLKYGSADFVFSRILLCGMTDWSGYVKQIFEMLAPGGWADMGDYVEQVFYSGDKQNVVPRDDWEWLREIRKGGARLGLDLDAGLTIRGYMEEAGFVDLQTWQYRVPFWRGAWEEQPEARRMAEHVIDDKWGLYWHMLPQLLDREKYNDDEVTRLRKEAKKDLCEEEGKYQLFCVTIGRKPNK